MNVAPDWLFDPDLDADRLTPDPEVDQLLRGAVDMHVHPAPSPFPRRISIVDAARDAASAGFRAIVVKSHHQSMQPDIVSLGSVLAEIPVDVHGGVALNDQIGGLNPYAVEVALAFGARVVWFPTISSSAHIEFHRLHTHSGFPRASTALRASTAISILDDSGAVKPEVHDILGLIAGAGAVLNCGHLPAVEIDVLIDAAVRAGVERIVVSHPGFVIGADAALVADWARRGAHIEHCLIMLVGDPAERPSLEQMRRFESAGVSRTIVSSDLGQRGHPLPVTAFRRAVRMLLDEGSRHDDIRSMIGGNAAELLRP